MGNNCNRPNNNENKLCDAVSLQRFFDRLPNSPEKDKLLSHYPLGYNYKCDINTNIAENISCFCDSYHEPRNSLGFQMNNLRFSYGCRIKVSKKYYDSLVLFAKCKGVNSYIKYWHE